MNILYLCDEYPPGRHGGIGTVVQITAREMVKQGHSVIVAGFYDWGYGGEDQFVDEGVNVYRFRRYLSSGLLKKQDALICRAVYKLFTLAGIWELDIKKSIKAYALFINDLIRTHAIDVVEMTDYNDYMRFCRNYVVFPSINAPLVVKMHGSMTYIARENGRNVPQHIWQMEHDVLQQANAVCSVSKYNAARTASYLDYMDNVEVLYNGINIPRLPDVTKKNNKVIFTGSLTENKGIFQLAKAWNIVNEQIPQAQLVLLGKGPVDRVLALVNDKAQATMTFTGHVSKDVLYMELADSMLAVFPSYAESFALAPMEAMAVKTAVVFTSRTSGPELIHSGENGILVDPADVEQLAGAIIYLLQNPDICYRYAEKGYQDILRTFSIDNCVRETIDYYANVLNTVS